MRHFGGFSTVKKRRVGLLNYIHYIMCITYIIYVYYMMKRYECYILNMVKIEKIL